MKKNAMLLLVLTVLLSFGTVTAAGQFKIKVPKLPKPDKPKTDQPAEPKSDGSRPKTETAAGDKQPLYGNMRPDATPVFLKHSVYVSTQIHDQYWKSPNERDYSSWVPLIRFDLFYNNEANLNYTVEYYNPDGSLWYSEKLEQGNSSADRTVLFRSPSPWGGVLDTKSTDKTGDFSFKINDQSGQTIYQGKFKVGKYSRANRPQEKNKNDFYVDHDWLAPFGMIGFHHSDLTIGGNPPEISFWLNGLITADELEGRLFYNGRQIASTRDEIRGSGVSGYDERAPSYAPAFAHQYIWKRWQFQWGNFLVDNNGPFNRENFPKAHFMDKNPGEYTVRVFHNGAPIRETSFTVGADGRYGVPAYSDQIFMPYHHIILPVKMTAAPDKFNPHAWKTDAFYGNPLNGFTGQ
jgi:hypothetical protein